MRCLKIEFEAFVQHKHAIVAPAKAGPITTDACWSRSCQPRAKTSRPRRRDERNCAHAGVPACAGTTLRGCLRQTISGWSGNPDLSVCNASRGRAVGRRKACHHPQSKKAGLMPADLMKTISDKPGARAERDPTRAGKLLLGLFRLRLLRLFRLLRFLSHSILFWVNGWKRDTRHARRRANLATASKAIPTDSRRAAPRCHAPVIALSTVVMHFGARFRRKPIRSAAQIPRRSEPSQRPAGSSGLTKLQRGSCARSSSIQNHGADCLGVGESPLTAAAAFSPQQTGIVMGGLFDNRGGALRVLDSRC
jgi:hypothetical protein